MRFLHEHMLGKKYEDAKLVNEKHVKFFERRGKFLGLKRFRKRSEDHIV